MSLNSYIQTLLASKDLATDEAQDAAQLLADADVPFEDKKAFLLALVNKGETATEVAAFASVYRSLVRKPNLPTTAEAIDIVGTGGDHFGSYNISTTAALIAAAGGVPVIKHGNRSITSKCGSADILERLGIAIQPDDETLAKAFETLGFVFLFAPAYHPAFKEIVPVRKAMAAEGKRSIFNLLGPLINPGQPEKLLMGVFSKDWVEPLARSLGALGQSSALVVHSDLGDGQCMDELSCAGLNHVAGVGAMSSWNGEFDATQLGFIDCSPEDLKGGDAERNMQLLDQLMTGTAPSGLSDTVCLNAGMAFLVAGKVTSLQDGASLASDVLQGGPLADWLKHAREFFAG